MDFLRKYRHVLAGLLILFVALQIPIYWKQDRSLGLPARVLYSLAYYPQTLWASVTGGVRSVLSQYVFLITVAKENDRLKKQNAELRGKLHELREVEQENNRLRGLLAMRERSAFDAVGARIIGLDSSAWFQSFTIDVGSDDGVESGMPVVSDEGLVGTVVSVAGKSSKVLPIVDMNSAVDVVSSRNRARGMLVGRGRERAFVNYLERSEDVREGDLLVTSGLGGAFPPGLPVAVIREVRPKTYGLFQDAYVDTVVRFSRLENLMVLRYREGVKIPAYVPPPEEAAPAAATAPAIVEVKEKPPAPAPAVRQQVPVTPAQAVAPPPPAPKKPRKPAPPPAPEPAPLDGGSPIMGGPALNLPSIPSGMPAGSPAANPVAEKKPAEEKKPAAEKQVEAQSAEQAPAAATPPAPAEKAAPGAATEKKTETAPAPEAQPVEAPLSGGTP